MSLALIREHADVKEEFDRLSKIRHEQFMSSVANMIAEIKSFAASYMKANDFLVTDHPEGKTITGTYKDVKISLKYPEVEERSPDAHSGRVSERRLYLIQLQGRSAAQGDR